MEEDPRDTGEVTKLLHEVGAGISDARERLAAIVYTDLRRVARGAMRARRRPGDSLESRQLVNDVLIRLLGKSVEWQNSAHFYGIAGREMRRLWIDYVRAKTARKRGGGFIKTPIDEVQLGCSGRVSVSLLALDEVLDRLEKTNPRWVKVFELIFFVGLTYPEAGQALGVAAVTVRRDFYAARQHILDLLAVKAPVQQHGHAG